MSGVALESKISDFLQRKEAEFPDAFSGRNVSHTVKYASRLRDSGQILFTH